MGTTVGATAFVWFSIRDDARAGPGSTPRHGVLTLNDFVVLVRLDFDQLLCLTARPLNADTIDRAAVPQSKVQRFARLAEIAGPRRDGPHQPICAAASFPASSISTRAPIASRLHATPTNRSER